MIYGTIFPTNFSRQLPIINSDSTFASSPNIGNCMFLKKETKYRSLPNIWERMTQISEGGALLVWWWLSGAQKRRRGGKSCNPAWRDMALPYYGTERMFLIWQCHIMAPRRMFLRDSMVFFCGGDDTGDVEVQRAKWFPSSLISWGKNELSLSLKIKAIHQ